MNSADHKYTETKILKVIAELKEKYDKAFDLIMGMDPDYWANSYFSGRRFKLHPYFLTLNYL